MSFALRDAVDLQASLSKIAVSDLGLRPKGSDVDWITVPSFLVSGTYVDLLNREARVESLSLRGVKLVTWLEPDGSFNLLPKLAQSPAAPAPPAPGATAAAVAPSVVAPAAAPAAVAPSWTFALGELALRDASISAEDRSTSPAVRVLLAPLSLQVEGVSLDLARPVSVSLDARINDAGSLNASGDVTPQPLSFNVAVKFDGIDLTAVQPYIGQHTSMTLLSGRLGGDVKVRYGSKKPAVQVTGDVSVAGLHTVDNGLREDFINWERVDLSGLNFQHDPDRLDIAQVSARKLYARVIVEPDTSLNVTRVLAGPGAPVVAPAAPGGARVAAAAAVNPSRASDIHGPHESARSEAPPPS